MSDVGSPLYANLLAKLLALTLEDNAEYPERRTTGEDWTYPSDTTRGLSERIAYWQALRRKDRSVKYVPHDTLIFSGSIGAASETFSFGIHGRFFAGDSGDRIDPSRDDRQAWLTTKVKPLAQAWFSDPAMTIHNAHKLTKLTLARIGENGRYDTDQTPAFIPVAAVGGLAAPQASAHPWQVALCVSLTNAAAATTQGRRGRFYLPPTGTGVEPSTNQIADVTCQAVADRTKTFLDAVNAAATGIAGAAWEFRLYGDGVRKNAPDVTGPSNRVTGVRVGNVLDTIRSRRNAAAEQYKAAALA